MNINKQLIITICFLFIIDITAFNVKYNIISSNIREFKDLCRIKYSDKLLISPRKYSLYRYTFLNLKLNENDDNDDDDFVENRLYPNLKPRKKNDSRAAVFSGKSKWQVINRAILAGMFIAGIGTGIIV